MDEAQVAAMTEKVERLDPVNTVADLRNHLAQLPDDLPVRGYLGRIKLVLFESTEPWLILDDGWDSDEDQDS